jgi:hypothetical protein
MAISTVCEPHYGEISVAEAPIGSIEELIAFVETPPL